MRWERLWSDLEAQAEARAEALARDELEAEVADRALIEQGSVAFMDRVRASVGTHLRCVVLGGQQWQGVLLGHGLDWLSLSPPGVAGQASVLLPERSLAAVSGLARHAVPLDALGLVARRVTMTMAMRRLMDGGELVRVHRVGSPPAAGRIVLVGRDYVDVEDDDEVTWSIPLRSVTAVALR